LQEITLIDKTEFIQRDVFGDGIADFTPVLPRGQLNQTVSDWCWHRANWTKHRTNSLSFWPMMSSTKMEVYRV